MAEQWIAAHQAYDLVQDAEVLCTRLHAGLIASRARLFKIGDQAKHDYTIPSSFWWAEGREALGADWSAGDFTTWIEHTHHCRAFGVEFALSGVLELLPIEKRALVARKLSVAGNPEWLTAKATRQLYYTSLGYAPGAAGDAIVELARLGMAYARAVLAEEPSAQGSANLIWQEREWDIPTWFWNGFTSSPDGQNDWEQGKFTVRCQSPNGAKLITASGVHFLLSSLSPDQERGTAPETASQAQRGRKPTYDWETVVTSIWGDIYRGDFIPSNQADIEKAMQRRLAKGDNEPSESTVRPYASRIWNEFAKA